MRRWMLYVLICSAFMLPMDSMADGVLDVKECTQKFDQWCWAGSSWTVLQYFGINLSQCEIAEYTRKNATFHDFGSVNCCEPSNTPGWKCNYWNYNWGNDGSILHILKNWKVENYGENAALTRAAVVREIDAKRPFIIRWGYNSGGGHFIVGHGIKETNLYYMDPWQGEGLKIAAYDWVKSNSQKKWTHTNVITTSPLPKVNVTADFSFMADNLIVDFTDQSFADKGVITRWQWDFGDKQSSSEASPTHTYSADGSYTVKLTAWEKGGVSGSKTKKVEVHQGAQRIAYDGFESKTFKKGEGWLRKSWKKEGDVAILQKTPFEGKYYVRMRRNTGRLKRTVDLSKVTSARLKFASRIKDFESGDKAIVKVSTDNVTYETVQEFTASDSDNQYRITEVDLRAFLPAKSLRIIFEAGMDDIKDFWFLDEIEITGN